MTFFLSSSGVVYDPGHSQPVHPPEKTEQRIYLPISAEKSFAC
jgi:hypothetical protein